LWLHPLKVAQLLRSAACLHTNQSRSYLNHLVFSDMADSDIFEINYLKYTGYILPLNIQSTVAFGNNVMKGILCVGITEQS
jgi:hypothetical protein